MNLDDVRTGLEKLAALGTPDAIAMEMEAQGIKAHRREGYSCAVARYLGNSENAEPEPGVVAVTHSVVFLHGDGVQQVPVRTPGAVAQFIDRFDHGYYPALIADPRPGHWEVS